MPCRTSPERCSHRRVVRRPGAWGGFVLGVAAGMGIGVRWGGDWDGDWLFTDQQFHDMPHFELTGEP